MQLETQQCWTGLDFTMMLNSQSIQLTVAKLQRVLISTLAIAYICNWCWITSDGCGRLLYLVYYHNLKSNYQLSHIGLHNKSLSSEILNCKITDNITHQESNVNLEDLLKTIKQIIV